MSQIDLEISETKLRELADAVGLRRRKLLEDEQTILPFLEAAE